MNILHQKSVTANDAVNLAPTTGAEAMFFVKEFLKASLGATVAESSDGTTYNAAGDQITTGASGAGGMANNSAWYRLVLPSGQSLTVQRGTSNTTWRIVWSHTAGTGGTPGATRITTAADAQTIIGGGTDAAPTFTSTLAGDGTYYMHCMGDADSPYAWCIVFAPLAAANTVRMLMFMPMAAGSYSSADTAAYIVQMRTGAATGSQLVGTSANTGLGQGYYQYGLGGQAWVNFRALEFYTGSVIIPNGLPSDPYDAKDMIAPIPVSRINTTDGVTAGWKGFISTAYMGWVCRTRTNSDYIDIDTSRYIHCDDLLVRFPQAITPLT